MNGLVELAARFGIAEPLGMGFFSVLLAFFVALGVVWRFIPALLNVAIAKGWADQPNARRLNTRPLPNAGGLAIFAGFAVALVLAWVLRPIAIQGVAIQVLAIALGGSWLVLVGFIDDQFGLSPLSRLTVQTFAALLLMVNGLMVDLGGIALLQGLPELGLTLMSGFLTWLWIVGLTNAFNLLDGVDGVVGGVSFVAAVVLLATAAQFPDRAAAVILLAALAGAALGYLRHNVHPSRIIMGDAGSTLLGFTLSAVCLLGTAKNPAAASLLLPLLVLALPILDTTQVVIGRLARGIRNPLAHPDKTHVHHRLLAKTNSARKTALLLWGISALFGVIGMLVQGVSPVVIAATLLAVTFGLGLVVRARIVGQGKETT